MGKLDAGLLALPFEHFLQSIKDVDGCLLAIQLGLQHIRHACEYIAHGLLVEVTQWLNSSLMACVEFTVRTGGWLSVRTNLMLSETRTMFRFDCYFWKFFPARTSLEKRAIIGFLSHVFADNKIRTELNFV